MKSVIIVSAQSEAGNFAVQTSKIRVANTYVLFVCKHLSY